jgi:hypothetical protein
MGNRRYDALVLIVAGLMWAIEHQDFTENQRDVMTRKCQLALIELGVGIEEIELAVYAQSDASHG